MFLVSQVTGIVENLYLDFLRHHKCNKCQTVHVARFQGLYGSYIHKKIRHSMLCVYLLDISDTIFFNFALERESSERLLFLLILVLKVQTTWQQNEWWIDRHFVRHKKIHRDVSFLLFCGFLQCSDSDCSKTILIPENKVVGVGWGGMNWWFGEVHCCRALQGR